MLKHAMTSLAACAALLLSAADMSVVTPNDEGVRGADDSASIQNAVDMAAKRGTGKVVIPAWNARTGKPGWTLSRAVLLPGDMTVVIDNARLALADDVYANFFRSANTWTKKGATPEGVLRNIRIIGLDTAVLDGAGQLRLTFDTPQRAVTPGQSAVLYDGERCLGGGIIGFVKSLQ